MVYLIDQYGHTNACEAIEYTVEGDRWLVKTRNYKLYRKKDYFSFKKTMIFQELSTPYIK